MPNGMMEGVLFGDTTFIPTGAVYAYDPENNLVASYEQKEKDIMRGYIGKLKPKAETHFYKTLESFSRFEKYKTLSKGDYLEIKSTIELVWTKGISFDNVVYWDYDKPENLPIKLSTDVTTKLKSDSIYRKDIQMRAKGEMDNAQAEKERI